MHRQQNTTKHMKARSGCSQADVVDVHGRHVVKGRLPDPAVLSAEEVRAGAVAAGSGLGVVGDALDEHALLRKERGRKALESDERLFHECNLRKVNWSFELLVSTRFTFVMAS